MISISIRKTYLSDMEIAFLKAQPILDSLKCFWADGDMKYQEFLNSIGVSTNVNYSSIDEMREVALKNMRLLSVFADSNQNSGFDFRAVKFLKNLKNEDINDKDFFEVKFGLENVSEDKLDEIKDIFLNTHCVSLISFAKIEDYSCRLIFYKKGAFFYNREPYLANTRESLSMLENYNEPRDNNFILARFLVDFSHNLRDSGVNESFCVSYSNGSENVKSIDEIIEWGSMEKDEKEERKERLKESQTIQKEAQSLAKNEIKAENNSTRTSLPKDSTQNIVDNASGTTQIFNIKNSSDDDKNVEVEKDSKEAIIQRNMEIYKQKELEKTNLRLQRAEKEAYDAYQDLKSSLSNGLSLLESLNVIKQKYRNEDTINFASLLFGQDIMNVFEAQKTIDDLQKQLSKEKNNLKDLKVALDNKDETISKMKSTIQKKVNELSELENTTRNEYEESLKNIKLKMEEELAFLRKSNSELEADYERELKNADLEISGLKQSVNSLQSQNTLLQASLTESKANVESLNERLKDSYRLEVQKESMEEKVKSQEREIEELKAKNLLLEHNYNNLVLSLVGSKSNEQQVIPRSKDLLK